MARKFVEEPLAIARMVEAQDRDGLFDLVAQCEVYQGWPRSERNAQVLDGLARFDGAEAYAISKFGQTPLGDGWALLLLARCRSHLTLEYAQRMLARHKDDVLREYDVCSALAELGTPRACTLLRKIAAQHDPDHPIYERLLDRLPPVETMLREESPSNPKGPAKAAAERSRD